MSVRLVYEKEERDHCYEAEQLSGYCFSILKPSGKLYGDKVIQDSSNILLDIGKYPEDLTLENPIDLTLDFGIVPVESKNVRDVIVYNSLQPRAAISKDFVVLPREPLMETYDNVFHILLPEKTDFLPSLQATCATKTETKFKFRVLFTPNLSAIAYTITFNLWLGTVPIRLRCHGFSEGPYVSLNENMINFGGQYYGTETRARLSLINHSICDASFQFDCDNFRSPFRICPPVGKIPAKKAVKVEIIFRPYKPQTYYKRVFCLLHQHNPQYVDLVGVCIPRPYFYDKPIDFCVSAAETVFLPLPSPTFEEYFNPNLWGIKLSQTEFNFGGLNAGTLSCAKPAHAVLQFTLTNTLPYDVMVDWAPDPTQNFNIAPSNAYLNSDRAVEFAINFTPNVPEVFYEAQLECYISPSTQIWPPAFGCPWIWLRRNEHPGTATPSAESAQPNPKPLPLPSQPKPPPTTGMDEGSKVSAEVTLSPEHVEGQLEEGMEKQVALVEEKKREELPPLLLSQISPKLRVVNSIPFEVYIFNQDESLKVSIVSTKHYQSTGLFGEPSRQENFSSCEPEEEILVIEDEEPQEAEEEDEEDTDAEQVLPKALKKSKGKKTKSKESSKGKSKEKGSKKKRKKDKDADPINTSENTEMETNKEEPKEGAEEPKDPVDGEKKKRKKKDKEKKSKKAKEGKEKSSKNGKDKGEKKSKRKKANKDKSEGEESEGKVNEQEFAGEYKNGNTNEEENQQEVPLPPTPPPLEKRISMEVFEKCQTSDPEEGLKTCPNELPLPLCLTVRASGHTYASSKQPPIPHFSIPSKVTMGPTLPRHREFRTILMKNTSDLPLLFDLQGFDKSDYFDAKPKIGVIPDGGQQILMLSMSTCSPYTTPLSHVCNVNMNCIDDNPMKIMGYAEVPSIILTLLSDPSKKITEIVCPTTVPGFATFAQLTMKNPSRFHYKFSIHISDVDDVQKNIFSPTPSEGILAPYDCITIKWKFLPVEQSSYSVPWNFQFEVMGAKNDSSFWNAKYQFAMPLLGLGSPCELRASPGVLDFDLVKIFSSETKSFTVTNMGTSVVNTSLVVLHEQWLQWYVKTQVTIEPSEVYLQAGESVEVQVTVRPDKPIMYKFYIANSLESGERNSEGAFLFPHERETLVVVEFMGDHAVAQVTELQQLAKHPAWGVDQAWEMFRINMLNEFLTPLKFSAREGSLPSVPTVTFEFPSSPLNSPPAVFSLVLKNLGDIKTYWQIHTQPPKNSKLYQLKHKSRKETFAGQPDIQDSPSFLTALWTQKYGALQRREEFKGAAEQKNEGSLNLTALRNSEHFRLTPTSGLIPERGHEVINFKCLYDVPGEYKMPVLLRIYPAMFVWLELTGKCLPQEQGDLQMANEFNFHPIALNDLDPPIQSLWIYNGGQASSPYRVNLEPLKKLQGENFGHNVIECLTPEGVALPKCWTALKFRFSPLEYQSYEALLKIQQVFTSSEISVKVQGTAAVAEDIDLRPKAKPNQTLVVDPFVPVTLFPNRAIFPHFIPTGDRTTGIVYLTNTSKHHSFSFAWPEVTYVNSTSISFLPDIGILAPGEQCACQVVVQAGSVNHIMSTTFRCWIEDVTAIDEYNLNKRMYLGEVVQVKEVLVVTKDKGPQRMSQAVIPALPVPPQPLSRLLTISCYIGSVFGRIDNICPREQTRMSFSDPVGIQPLPREGEGDGIHHDDRLLILSPTNRHIAKEVLTQILWDMMLLSPNWSAHLREAAKRHSVYFDEYKNSELSQNICEELLPAYHLPRKVQEEILEFSFFNMLQEMADHFSNGKTTDWAQLGPGLFSSSLEQNTC